MNKLKESKIGIELEVVKCVYPFACQEVNHVAGFSLSVSQVFAL